MRWFEPCCEETGRCPYLVPVQICQTCTLQPMGLAHGQLAILSILQALPRQAGFTQLFSHIGSVKCVYPPTCACRGCHLLHGGEAAKLGRGSFPWVPSCGLKKLQRRCWSIPQSRLGSSSLLLIQEAAPQSRGWREHPTRWGLGKGHQAAVQCPADHSPHPVFQDPSSTQSTRTQILQVRMKQHKRQQMQCIDFNQQFYINKQFDLLMFLSLCRCCSGG